MNFQLTALDDFLTLSTAYSTFMRIFYWSTSGLLIVYGFPATMPFVLEVEDTDGSAVSTLLTAFPSAIQLAQPIDLGNVNNVNIWADFQAIVTGITDATAPPQVVYYIQDGVFYLFALDPPTKTCITCIDRSPIPGLETAIHTAFPTVVKFNSPVQILESE